MANLNFLSAIIFSYVATGEYDHAVVKAFEMFQSKFGKKYKNQEEANKRLAVFSENILKAAKMNAEHVSFGGNPVFGVTKFSDLTEKEFEERYLSYRSQKGRPKNIVTFGFPVPDKVDWREQGAVNRVRDQGQMGSAEIIPVVESVESKAKISGKYPLFLLSIEQVVDCCDDCTRFLDSAIQNYIVKNGLETGANYQRGKPCGYNASKVSVEVSSFENVPKNEDSLRNASALCPVSVCLAASSWQSYSGGILSRCDTTVDHCALVVGYDYSSSPPFWIVQNSWGASWGEMGYIRIEAGKDLCKIADSASYPIV